MGGVATVSWIKLYILIPNHAILTISHFLTVEPNFIKMFYNRKPHLCDHSLCSGCREDIDSGLAPQPFPAHTQSLSLSTPHCSVELGSHPSERIHFLFTHHNIFTDYLRVSHNAPIMHFPVFQGPSSLPSDPPFQKRKKGKNTKSNLPIYSMKHAQIPSGQSLKEKWVLPYPSPLQEAINWRATLQDPCHNF